MLVGVAIGLLCFHFYQLAVSSPAEAVFNNAVRSVVVIECIEGRRYETTAGFVATDRGHIITVAHGLTACLGKNEKNIIVRFFDNPEIAHAASIVRLSKLKDVAVLFVPSTPANVPSLPINISRHYPGEATFIIGHAELFYWSIMQGIISADRIYVSPLTHLIQIDAGIIEGNSGGPVLNKGSEVIGIGQFYVVNHPVLGFCIAGDTLKQYLRGL